MYIYTIWARLGLGLMGRHKLPHGWSPSPEWPSVPEEYDKTVRGAGAVPHGYPGVPGDPRGRWS